MRRDVGRKSSATACAAVALLLTAYAPAPATSQVRAVPPRPVAVAVEGLGPHLPTDETRPEIARPVHPAARASRGRLRTLPKSAPKGDPLLVPFGPLTERHLAALRGCENGGEYTSAPGDRYRGAYQAYRDTWRRLWRRLGRPAYAALDPAAASRRVQDAFARWLHRVAGRGQWPYCGRPLP